MLNRATLTGRLTRDPELRYTNSGTAVVRFSLAVDRQFRNQQTGEREADFINCVIWRKSAENFANFTHKGALVGIDGRITTSNYQNQQGQRVYRTEVTVDNFALLEHGRHDQGITPMVIMALVVALMPLTMRLMPTKGKVLSEQRQRTTLELLKDQMMPHKVFLVKIRFQ